MNGELNGIFRLLVRPGVLPLLAACTLTNPPPPQLGKVEDGFYHHAEGWFTCAVPGAAEHFGPAVKIRDAVQLTRNVFNVEQNREVTVPDGYRPSLEVIFTDAADPASRLEITIEKMYPGAVATYEERGEKSDIYRARFEHGNLGLLGEARQGEATPYTGFGIVQFPYWGPDMGYMGVNLAEAYRRGETSIGPIEVQGRANFVLPGKEPGQYAHYHVSLSQDARGFLPGDVDPRDVEAVYRALKRNPDVVPAMRATLTQFLARCQWSIDTPSS